jgi:hypothetical protein
MVCLISALRQSVQCIRIPGNQSLLLSTPPALNLFLTEKSIFNTVTFLTVNQRHRQSFCSMLRSNTALVLSQTLFEIPGTPGVITFVSTFKNIHIWHCRILKFLIDNVPFDSAQGTTTPLRERRLPGG